MTSIFSIAITPVVGTRTIPVENILAKSYLPVTFTFMPTAKADHEWPAIPDVPKFSRVHP
jgi:hypothetical protein